MKLYTIPNCPFCHRVKIALKERKITNPHIEIIEINLKDPPKGFLKISEQKTVPAIELSDGSGFPESMIIIEFLDSLDGEGNLLFGNKAINIAKTKILIDTVNKKISEIFQNAVFTFGNKVTEKKVFANIPIAFYEIEKILEQNKSRFFGGDSLNAADIHLIPFIYFYHTISIQNSNWPKAEKNSRAEKYMNDVFHHSSVRKVLPHANETYQHLLPFFSLNPEINKIKNSSREYVKDIETELVTLNENLRKKLKGKKNSVWHKNTNSNGDHIEATFFFKNYNEALNALQAICEVQESANHHSHFTLDNFTQLKVEVCTHQPKWGVTPKDFAFAEVLTQKIIT